MPAERATALVVRTTDWSETSRIATLWSRERGKIRVLAKGGRRVKSSFEVSLDLLNVCNVVSLTKTQPGLEVLTEAQLAERFPRLRDSFPAFYGGMYVAELLCDLTEEHDPHPALFDAALATLRDLPTAGVAAGLRVVQFELTLLAELGYSPPAAACALCAKPLADGKRVFGPTAGGLLCPACQPGQRDRLPIAPATADALFALLAGHDAWRADWPTAARREVRHLLGMTISARLGRRPKLLPYLAG